MGKILRLISALTVMFAVNSCGGGSTAPVGGGGGGGGGGTCPAGTFCMGSSSFFPASRTVAPGSTVVWLNDSGTPHNVTWDNAAGRSAALAGDGTGDIPDFQGSHNRKFNAAGDYGFHCTIHAGMTGTLTVQ